MIGRSILLGDRISQDGSNNGVLMEQASLAICGAVLVDSQVLDSIFRAQNIPKSALNFPVLFSSTVFVRRIH